MDKGVKTALETDRVIDITTIGRKSGQPRRIEIWFHNLDGRIFITGLPGRRSWYANMVANPAFTFHLKESVQADLAATATPITDENARKEIFNGLLQKMDRIADLDKWLADSPLIEVTFD